MTSAAITGALNGQLPAVLIACNPRAVRELATRAGRPYQRRVDEILEAFNEPKAVNYDAPLRDVTFRHAGRQVTLLFARVRGYGSSDMPKTRTMAISVECLPPDVEPDRLMDEYITALKASIVKRGEGADAVLQEVTGTTFVWDEAA